MRRHTALVLMAAALLLGGRRLHAQAQDPDVRCAACHRQIYESWKRTPMANASGPAAQGFIPADFTHAASGVHYRMDLEHGQVWLSYQRPNAPPARALSGRQLLLYYLGSGRRGRTWIYQREGYWYELPINWYAKKHMWDMTPHFLEAQSMPFTLPVDPGCLHCHASDVQASLPEARNKFDGPPFPHGGITCAACHGDPARHLASGGREPVLDPAKLTAIRRASVCLECHLEGEVAVVKQGQKLGDFHPGDNLFEEAVYFEDGRKVGAEGRATSQWESLLESACKRASGDRLTCTTCHDPHATVAPEERVAYYRARCLSCHTGLASGHHAENPDCTSCHMPRQATEDIAHEQVTDHRIQIPGKPFHRMGAADELVAIGGSQPTPRDEGIAWAELALRGDQAAGERALGLLLQAESGDPKQASDADLHVNLGFLEQANGDSARAAAEYEQALQADPRNETAAADLAVLDARKGNFAAATPLLAKVFQDDPGASTAGVDLAVAECRQGDAAAAAETLRRVLLFSPDDDTARRFSLALAGGTATCGAAAQKGAR
ncbi:MAG TPA: tetratricopeptide repeat protein [Acidobacteriaceae bacterium]|jgi:predicted CXXCH cytochrome family protein|nr:tetratricopeptide repeat protein [Acidobacteriaceae bacterium]